MAHGKIRVNTLTYDTGSGDVDVAVNNVLESTVSNTFTADQTFASTQTYPRIPGNTQSSNYSLQLSDAGKHINLTGGNITIPLQLFSAGDAITVFNADTVNRNVEVPSGVILTQAGTTRVGNRTLKQNGLATILCIGANNFVISGAGLI
jgi:hypothetical protein